jgi:uncharacterized protein YndB with AHSA1/START domain
VTVRPARANTGDTRRFIADELVRGDNCDYIARYPGVGGPCLAQTVASDQGGNTMTVPGDILRLTRPPIAKAEMLIRKPVADVFQAIIDPAITTKFWFTKSSGKLEPGAEITWEWEMYNFSVPATVKAIEQNRRIVVEWGGYGTPTTIEWTFTPHGDNATFVSITNEGFSGDGDEAVSQAVSSTEGFTFVLAGLKAVLEHDLNLNLIGDRMPT